MFLLSCVDHPALLLLLLQTRLLHRKRRLRGGIQAIVQMRWQNHIAMQANIVTEMTVHRDLARSDLSDWRPIVWVTEEHHYLQTRMLASPYRSASIRSPVGLPELMKLLCAAVIMFAAL